MVAEKAPEVVGKTWKKSWKAIQAKSLYISDTICIKGQLILKCPFGVFKSSKKPTKIFPGFLSALASEKRSNQKTKGTLYH